MLARDVMIGEVATVASDEKLAEVAHRLAGAPAGAVVVVDENRNPIGVVTRSDLTRDADGPPIPDWLIKHKAVVVAMRSDTRKARDVMSAPAIVAPDAAQMLEVATIMERRGLKRLPVVNGDGVVGLLRRADVLQAVEASKAPAPRAARATAAQFRLLARRHEELEQAQRAEAHRLAQEARKQLIEAMAARRLSDHDWSQMLHSAQRAASEGFKEVELLRFPAALCSDGGRAINAPDPNWPRALRGEARDVFERWRTELQPAGFGLAAQIATFPDGMPGDAALILIWGAGD